ncbi:MAG: dihydroorotate dehydrogenase electron transfer subunit [Firmicutes bacterium]|nr:dihydroorotate dehydrogenase electron transfer subunit [Bacillota bacterium]
MKDERLKIVSNRPLTEGAAPVWEMVFSGVTEPMRPGQFVQIALPGRFLRRPISVCDLKEDPQNPGTFLLTVVYKVVGQGTADMTGYQPNDELSVLTGLGNGYDLSDSGDDPLLLGGGVGTPPMYFLAKELIKEGKSIRVILGFNRADEVFYEEEFRRLGARVNLTTVDGSYGQKGFVTDVLPEEISSYYACGPEPMLKAVHKKIAVPGQLSFESRMGCGFGACMGCTMKTAGGYKRICKEGPVLRKEEILWEN